MFLECGSGGGSGSGQGIFRRTAPALGWALKGLDGSVEAVTLCYEESDDLRGFHSPKFSTEFLAVLVPKVSKIWKTAHSPCTSRKSSMILEPTA